MDNLNSVLANVIAVVGFITKISCWVPHQLKSEIKRSGPETGQRLLAHFLDSEARVMIFCTALSQATKVVCVSVTGNLKKQSLEYHHPTSPRKKKFETQLSAGKCMFIFFWATEAYSQGVHGQGMGAIRS